MTQPPMPPSNEEGQGGQPPAGGPTSPPPGYSAPGYAPPSAGQQPPQGPPPPHPQQPPAGYQPMGGHAGPPPPGYAPGQPGAPGGYGYDPNAPYGIDPATGLPYSEKQKLLAGLLNILLSGVGRMYAGHVGLGVTQLIVTILTCGIGALWSIIDGIMILANGGTDGEGRPLRPN